MGMTVRYFRRHISASTERPRPATGHETALRLRLAFHVKHGTALGTSAAP